MRILCKYLRVFTAATVLTVVLITPAQACRTAAPEFAELLASRWVRAFRKADAQALDAIYAPDAVVASFASARPIATEPEMRKYIAALTKTCEPVGPPMSTLRLGCNTILDFGVIVLKPRGGPLRGAFEIRYGRIYEQRSSAWKIVYETATETRTLRQHRAAPPVGLQRERSQNPTYGALQPPRLIRKPEVAGMLIRDPEAGPQAATAPAQPEQVPPQRPAPKAPNKKAPEWISRAFKLD